MKSRIFRAITATTLAVSLWSGTLSAMPQSQDPQDLPPPPPPKPTPVEPAQTEPAKPAATAPAQAPAKTQTPAKTAKKKPLSVDEDPAMIGKRKLNSGLIASMSGSLEKEVAIGRQVALEIEKELKLVDDPAITEYINRVGQNIVLHSDAKVPFTIKVVDSDEINAFALPGGFFFVNKGLILAADNESEIAGVMAHEIAHVTARHAMEQQAKGMLANIGLNVGQIFLPGLGGLAVLTGAQFLTTLGFLKFSRAAEEEADKLGLQYMYAAGYDPSGMATMFEKLAAQNKKKPGKVAKLFSTHPQSDNRRVAVLNLAARFPEQEEYVISTSEFQKVKGRLLRLSNARATTSGVIADDGDSGRPTLKRRLPSGEGATTPSDSNNKTEEPAPDRPTLRRGDTKPTPTPTPEP
jgi:predicted Zn-dependent protease